MVAYQIAHAPARGEYCEGCARFSQRGKEASARIIAEIIDHQMHRHTALRCCHERIAHRRT